MRSTSLDHDCAFFKLLLISLLKLYFQNQHNQLQKSFDKIFHLKNLEMLRFDSSSKKFRKLYWCSFAFYSNYVHIHKQTYADSKMSKSIFKEFFQKGHLLKEKFVFDIFARRTCKERISCQVIFPCDVNLIWEISFRTFMESAFSKFAKSILWKVQKCKSAKVKLRNLKKSQNWFSLFR